MIRTLFTVAVIASTCLAAGAQAQSSDFEIKLPGRNHFNGGILFVTFIGPEEGNEITNTSVDINWHQTGEGNPEDLQIVIEVQVNDELVHRVVTGQDLGFTDSGTGLYRGSTQFPDLNGDVWQYTIFPHSLVYVEISNSSIGNANGYFTNSTISFDLEPTSCISDFNGDGEVNSLDVLAYLNAYLAGDAAADINEDGVIDTLDLVAFLQAFASGC